MVAYIKGELVAKEEDRITIDVNGIGYQIYMPLHSLGLLPELGEDIRIHTYLHVKEEVMQLFGFLTKDDLNVFKLLITVNGIGPKGGLNILSQLSPDDLRFAIMSNDIKTIASTPGIGKKTAEKLIIELRDKLSIDDIMHKQMSNEESIRTVGHGSGIQAEAIQALVALGYGSAESAKAVKRVEFSEDMTVEMLLKMALKNMMF